jgi:hypothetical protein
MTGPQQPLIGPDGLPLSAHPSPYGAPQGDAMPASDRGSNPPAAGQYAVAIGVGVLIAVLIGGGGWYAWRTRSVAASAEPTAQGSVVVPTPVPVGSVAPAASASSQAGVSAEIAFNLTPAEATLSIDGKELPPGTKLVPRPPVGKNAMVTFRAPGHEDMTVSVDYFTTSPKDVALKRLDVAAGDGAPTAGTAATDPSPTATATTTATTATKKDPTDKPAGDKPPAKPRPKQDPGLPANPY